MLKNEEKQTKDKLTSFLSNKKIENEEAIDVYYNSKEPEKFHANALASNSKIYLKSGKQSLLKHEKNHIHQQRNGLVKPTVYKNGYAFNFDERLEYEADHKVCSMDDRSSLHSQVQPVIQCSFGEYSIDNIVSAVKKEQLDWNKENHKEVLEALQKYINSFVEKLSYLEKTTSFIKSNSVDQKLSSLLHAFNNNKNMQKLFLETEDKQAFLTCMEMDIPYKSSESTKTPEKAILLKTESFKEHEILELMEEGDLRNFFQYIHILREITTEDGIQDTLKASDNNVNASLFIAMKERYDERGYREEFILRDKKRYVKIYLSRLKLMTTFMKKVYDAKEKKFWVFPSGSDPHTGGRQALFLQRKIEENEKPSLLVYKEHEIESDKALSGTDSLMSLFKVAKKSILPSMEFFDERTEEFVNHSTLELSETQAKTYFYKLGALEFIASIVGGTDLHCDNIMALEDGPLIIDGECAFVDFSGTLISSSNGPLKRYRDNDDTKISISTFFVKLEDNKKILSTQAYKKPQFKKCFNEGLTDAKIQFGLSDEQNQFFNENRKGKIEKRYREILTGVKSVRIVLVSTADLGVCLKNYLTGTNKVRKKVINFYATEILTAIDDERYLYNIKNSKIIEQGLTKIKKSNRKVIKRLLTDDMKAGIIPEFTFLIQTGEIKMDGEIIATIKYIGKNFGELYKNMLIEKVYPK